MFKTACSKPFDNNTTIIERVKYFSKLSFKYLKLYSTEDELYLNVFAWFFKHLLFLIYLIFLTKTKLENRSKKRTSGHFAIYFLRRISAKFYDPPKILGFNIKLTKVNLKSFKYCLNFSLLDVVISSHKHCYARVDLFRCCQNDAKIRVWVDG